MTTRRDFVLAFGAGALAPFTVFAQQKIWRIGFFGTAFAAGYVNELEWIRAGLRKSGYEEGKNVHIEYRWAEGNEERMRKIAAEFAAQLRSRSMQPVSSSARFPSKAPGA